MASKFRSSLTTVHDWIYQRRGTSTVIMLGLVALYAALELGSNWMQWAQVKWMLVTGLPVGFLFIWRTNDIRARFEEVADRLSKEKFIRFAGLDHSPDNLALIEDDEEQAVLHEKAKARVEEDAAVWGFTVCLIFVPLCFFVLHLINRDAGSEMQVLLQIVVLLMAIACGLRIGRMACYGWQGLSYKTMKIEDRRVAILPKLGHPDGGAGLAPIGRFYNLQVSKMAWLIGFLLVWLLILAWFSDQPFVEDHYPAGTSQGLFALLALIFLQQILGFFLPMWSIHRQLRSWKDQEMERNFDELRELESRQQHGSEAQAMALFLRKIDLRQQRADIATMGLWPVSLSTLRKFWVGKAATASIALVASYNDISDFLTRFIG